MESSSEKIILVQYKFHISEFFIYTLFSDLNSFITSKIVIRFYIASVQEDTLIIEVILKDQKLSTENLRIN